MAIIDDFKSVKNRSLIIQASTKMLLDKYRLSLSAETLTNIMNAIISAMSKDAILMNNTIKLMELNTITLAKMKDYIIKNIETVRNDANITPDIEENILDGINASGSSGSVSSGGSGSGGINASDRGSGDGGSIANSIANASGSSISNGDIGKEEYSYNKGDILSNEELLIRVKEYENSRAISTTILTSVSGSSGSGSSGSGGTLDNSQASTGTQQTPSILPEIMEKVLTSINSSTNTFVNKKTLIINSFSRDWINNPKRNQLSFTVNIDLQSNIIEPLKILFPRYVKDISPYIVLVITDNHRTFKYNFLYSKSSGRWDIWELINKDSKVNNINNNINLANKTWKIHFLDYLGNELNLGKDDIKISQINDYQLNYGNNTSIDTNIDNILIPHNLTKDAKNKQQSFYEINIDYSNQLEYDEYNLGTVSKYDCMLLKTYKNNYVNIKVLEVNGDLGKIIMLNENGLEKEDFVNSSLLNYGAQYSLILTYYPIRNAI
jgi:hypothetical protein